MQLELLDAWALISLISRIKNTKFRSIAKNDTLLKIPRLTLEMYFRAKSSLFLKFTALINDFLRLTRLWKLTFWLFFS